LTWECIDFETGVIRFKHQLSRAKRDIPARLVPLKSGGDRRDVEMIPALARLLAQHKLASPYARDDDFVFATGTGRRMYYRNASARGLDEGAKRAGLNADPSLPKLSFHDLRHSATHKLVCVMDVAKRLTARSGSRT
jgi:integrase